VEAKSSAELRAELSGTLDELELHRAFGVAARLEGAIEAQRAARVAGAQDLQMRARLVEADMRLRSGQATKAAHLATEVNQWAHTHGPTSLLARSHMILSSIFEAVGDSASCLDQALRAIELLDDDTPARARGNYVMRLADALGVVGSFDAARQRYREAERLFVGIGDTERQVSVLNNLAYTEYEAGDAKRAWVVSEEMRHLAEGSGFELAPPILDTIARACIGVGDLDQAARVLETALEILERGDVEAITPAGLMLALAEVRLGQGRLEAAQVLLDRCLNICVERNLGGIRVGALQAQAEIHAAAGSYADAYAAHRAFHAEFEKLNSVRREADALTRQAIFETAEARSSAERFWRQARTDALTGLPNRRYVDEEMPRSLAGVTATAPLVVAIVDADHFKRVNDTFSHEVGDRVICELARVLQAAIAAAGPARSDPGSRLVARLGGEEFLVVLPGLDMATATPLLKRLRNAVARHDWRPLIGTMTLTVSAGATAALRDDTQSTLLARADESLYRAKAAGRNCVIVDSAAPNPVPALPRVLRATSSTQGRAEANALVTRVMAGMAVDTAAETVGKLKAG
jgi:two-component system, cell cycle response regulator